MIDLARALAVYAEPPGPEHHKIAELLGIPAPTPAEHADLFLFQLFPYASVQLGPEGQLGGIARDRVTGFFRALTGGASEDADHLADLLGAYANLLAREQANDDPAAPGWATARATLLVEHLLPWIPAFARRAADLGAPAYRGWASLLDDFLESEAARTPLASSHLSAHLGHAEALPDPRASSANDFVYALLVPSRTGIILTASDLALAAEHLHLGRRVGERQYVLRSLLDQDATAVLNWLSTIGEAESAAWHNHWLSETPTGRWWRDRAHVTAQLLGDLADEVKDALRGLAGSGG